jgi:peptidyl-tRNA hydrolase, PTH1 family
MKLVVGLGNPGRKYAGTRHNVGFDVVDLIAERHRLVWESAPTEALQTRWRAESAIVAKPLTFMNLSGIAIGELLRFYKIELPDLFIVVDDINLELGRLRARPSGSAGGHNGLKSIISALGTEEFARLRVGIGRGDRPGGFADHVLAKFEPEEQAEIAEATRRAADAAELFVTDDIVSVMNRFNRKEDGE